MVQICPNCNNKIGDDEPICPHCDYLFYIDNQNQKCVRTQGNKFLIPLGIILLIAAYLYNIYQSSFNDIMHFSFLITWIIGFAIFFIFLRKGEYFLFWI
jgi:hypothetical protein